MSDSNSNSAPHQVEECRGVLFVFSDGSIRRLPKPSFNVPVHDDAPPTSTNKLPIFFYIHGGGFCIGSRSWPNCKNYCFRLASELQAVIIAPDYRLAPENRLPAAIEDGCTAVFISGDSAGGNIAHNLAVKLGAGSPELAPVHVKGYVLLAPFFGGTVRSKSEAEGPKDAFLNLDLIDRFWRLSIPIGDTTDHPLVNPFGPRSRSLEEVKFDPILVVVGGSDLLKDRAEDYAKKLKAWGNKIEYVEFEGQQHGVFTIHPNSQPSNQLMRIINKFIAEISD
ncbi:hypothetical protein Pint_31729 [Pistacia integerrima]|uniref:Uncharacterized protein n=1 Tax=Pistacia integerrima TaxID=434235 RepID=A0ACC0XN36_9ROSI|nr:hypothetical protein Pint_31729 [Pistacia integerrima]